MSDSALKALTDKIIAFRDERDWAQYHNPKDLAAGLAIEAAELQELFLWKSPEEVTKTDEVQQHVDGLAEYNDAARDKVEGSKESAPARVVFRTIQKTGTTQRGDGRRSLVPTTAQQGNRHRPH